MRRHLLLLLWVGLLGAGSAIADDMYAISNDGPNPSLLTVDTTNGMIKKDTPITGVTNGLYGLTHDGVKLWSIDANRVDELSEETFKIDPLTGTGTAVGMTGYILDQAAGGNVEFDPQTNALYAITPGSFDDHGKLYTINRFTGVATLVAPISGGPELDQVTAFAIAANGKAYITDVYPDPIFTNGLFELDLATGETTPLGDDIAGFDSFWFDDLAFDSSGQLWGLGKLGGDVYRIDIASLTATKAFKGGGSWTAIAFKLLPRLPLCFKWTAFCDGVQVNNQGIGGGSWYHFDCATNSPMDVSPNGNWSSVCGTPGKRLLRSTAGNGPGAYYFVVDLPMDGTLDMHMGTYPSGVCWIPKLEYILQFGACHDLPGQLLSRSSIQ